MKLRSAVALVVLGLALGACQSRESASDETEKLAQRVAELEAALAERVEEPAEPEVAQPGSPPL